MMCPAGDRKGAVRQNIPRFQPISAAGGAEKLPIARHKGGGGQFFREVGVRCGETNHQRALVHRLHSEILERRPAGKHLFRVFDIGQLCRIRRAGGRVGNTADSEQKIRRRNLYRVFKTGFFATDLHRAPITLA